MASVTELDGLNSRFGSLKHTPSERLSKHVPGTTALASLGSLVDIPILEKHSRSTESETLRAGAEQSVL